jgi:hypothetical protein
MASCGGERWRVISRRAHAHAAATVTTALLVASCSVAPTEPPDNRPTAQAEETDDVAPMPTEAAAVTWSVQDTAGLPGILAGVSRDGDRFLAAADLTISESDDGLTWKPIAELPADGSQIHAFQQTGEWFVAETIRNAADGAVHFSSWASRDGTGWQQVAGQAADPNVGGVVRLGDQWVATSFDGLFVAGDAGGWQPIEGPKPFDRVEVANAENSVAFGVTRSVGAPTHFRARVLFSEDARTWVESELAPGTAIIEAIAWGHGRYVVLGKIREKRSAAVPDPKYHATAWWSEDGRTWSAGDVEQDPNVNMGLAAKIVPLADGFVAIGSDGNDPASLLWSSTDGSSWRQLESGAGIAYPDVVDIVCAEDRLMVYSTAADGSTEVAISDQSVACPGR